MDNLPDGYTLRDAALACLHEFYPNFEWHVVQHEIAPAAWMEWSLNHSHLSMPVSLANAEATMFHSPINNACGRAWHDAVHHHENLSFSYEDEVKVAMIQLDQLDSMDYTHSVIRAFEADIIGQVLYHANTGKFPDNQAQFVREYLQYGALVLNGEY